MSNDGVDVVFARAVAVQHSATLTKQQECAKVSTCYRSQFPQLSVAATQLEGDLSMIIKFGVDNHSKQMPDIKATLHSYT